MPDSAVISLAKERLRAAWHLWYLLPAAAAAGVFWVSHISRRAPSPPDISPATHQPADHAAYSPYDSPEARARLAKQLRAASGSNDIRKLLAIVAQTNPKLALEMAQSFAQDDLERNILASAIVQAWAIHDPAGAWQWSLGAGKQWDVSCNPALSDTVLTGMAATNPQLILQTVDGILGTSGNTSDPTFTAIHALVAAGNLAAAQQALAAWSQGPFRNDISGPAFAEVAAAMASISPIQAAAWLQTLPPSTGLASGFGAVASTWAYTDPAGAMAWADGLNSQENRDGVINTIFNAWVTQNPTAAAEWFNAHDADPAADQMLFTWLMGSSLRVSSPATALQWAELITNDNLRSDAVQQTVLIWAQTDPVAAANFVDRSLSLTSEQKSQLLQQFPTPAGS